MISIVLSLLLLAAEPIERKPMCLCIAGKSIEEQIESADLIFEGIVLKQEPYPSNWRSLAGDQIQPTLGFGSSIYVFFAATKVWKGSRLQDLVVSTHSQESMCGYPFEDGERYLVYANVRESQTMTSICVPTKPLGDAAPDRHELNARFPE